MDNLSKLQRRKATLAAQIEQQRADMKKTLIDIREEIEPAKLLKKAVVDALGFSKNKPGDGTDGTISRLPAPVAFLVDVLVRDPKWAIGLKLLGPVALKFWPKFNRSKSQDSEEDSENIPEKSAKAKLYSGLRKGVSALRDRLRKTEKVADANTTQSQN